MGEAARDRSGWDVTENPHWTQRPAQVGNSCHLFMHLFRPPLYSIFSGRGPRARRGGTGADRRVLQDRCFRKGTGGSGGAQLAGLSELQESGPGFRLALGAKGMSSLGPKGELQGLPPIRTGPPRVAIVPLQAHGLLAQQPQGQENLFPTI